jgi:hypothetical protein
MVAADIGHVRRWVAIRRRHGPIARAVLRNAQARHPTPGRAGRARQAAGRAERLSSSRARPRPRRHP